MQLHIKTFCVPMSTGALMGDQSLKIPSYSISECVIFQGVMPPDPMIMSSIKSCSHTRLLYDWCKSTGNVNEPSKSGAAP